MKKYLHILILSAVMSMLFIAPCIAQIPISDPWQKPVSLDLKDVSVRTALEALLKGERINYSIDPNVLPEYVIPAYSVKDVPLRTALKLLCKTSGLECMEDKGITIISVSPAQWAKWSKQVSVKYEDIPLREVLNDLFKEADAGAWKIDPNIPDIKVRYTASDVLFVDALREILKPSAARFTWGSIISGDPTKRLINLEAKNMPLSDVLGIIFDNTGLSYTIDQNLEAMSMTATLKNTPFEVALRSVTSTAGLVYRVRDNVYIISAKPKIEPITLPSASASSAGHQDKSEMVTEVISMKYVNAGDIAQFVTGRSGTPIGVTTTSSNKLILCGTKSDIDAAQKIISALDVESALPRPVRLKLLAKVTMSTAKGPKIYSTSTESVGAEQTNIKLHLQTVKGVASVVTTISGKQVKKQPETEIKLNNLLFANIKASIDPDSRIGLSGSGSFSFPLGGNPEDELNKSFDISTSVEVGKPYTIAAGSIDLVDGKVDFTMTITATVEKGRVHVAPQQEQNTSPNGFAELWN